MYQICSQLTLKKLGLRYWPHSVVFIVVSFEHILHTFGVSIFGFEEVYIHLFKVSNGGTRTMYQICSKLTIKKLGSHYWPRFGVFIVVNLEQILHIVLTVPLLALKKLMPDEWGCSRYLWRRWNDQVIVCLIIKLKFWDYWTRFDSKQFFGILLLSLRSPIYDIYQKLPPNDPPTFTIRKNELQIYCLK